MFSASHFLRSWMTFPPSTLSTAMRSGLLKKYVHGYTSVAVFRALQRHLYLSIVYVWEVCTRLDCRWKGWWPNQNSSSAKTLQISEWEGTRIYSILHTCLWYLQCRWNVNVYICNVKQDRETYRYPVKESLKSMLAMGWTIERTKEGEAMVQHRESEKQQKISENQVPQIIIHHTVSLNSPDVLQLCWTCLFLGRWFSPTPRRFG